MFGKIHKIGIIGAGGWGTAVATLLNANNYNVTLWTHETDVVSEINNNHTNSTYLKGIDLNKNIKASSDPKLINKCDLLILAVPTQYIRQVLINNKFNLKNKILVNLSKGIEKGTLMRVSEILVDSINFNLNNYIVLTGPSHAEEVARKLPTTVVAASENIELAKTIQKVFSNSLFRVYTSEDIIGCELGGALKNIIALASGIIDGLGLGDNTKAALITRGLAGMTRLGVMLGAKSQTFSGLSGLGDVFVTCSSQHSRNRYVGEQIGKGKKLSEITKDMKMVAEGVHTTESAYFFGKKHNVEMPIANEVYKILFEDFDPMTAVKNLMTREIKNEWWW